MTQKTDRLISAVEVAYRADLHLATTYRRALRGEIPGLVERPTLWSPNKWVELEGPSAKAVALKNKLPLPPAEEEK